MTSPLVLNTLLLAPDPRQTVLATVGLEGLHRQSYSAYGYQHGPTAPRMGFNGQIREPQGWYHLGNGHRLYNPALMRFHSQDTLSPFGKGGLNGYAYCLGDPVNFTDPTGQFVDALFDWAQPSFTLMLNAALLATGLLTAAVTGPAGLVGLALWSSRMSVVGATLGIGGAAMQLATPVGSTARRVGRGISLLGTGLAVGGAATRGWMQYSKLRQPPGGAWDKFREGARTLVKGHRRPSVPPSDTPAEISMNVIPPTPTGGPPLSGALPPSAGATGVPGPLQRVIAESRGSFSSLSPMSMRSTRSASLVSRTSSIRSSESYKSFDPSLDDYANGMGGV